jgi:hypothetical protein
VRLLLRNPFCDAGSDYFEESLVCFFRWVIETQADVTIDLAVTDEIPITLNDARKGEAKAQACVIACCNSYR